MLGNLIGGFIVIIVGLSLLPTVNVNITRAQGGNVTGSASTILGLSTLFFTLAIASAGIAIAAQGLRAAGMLG